MVFSGIQWYSMVFNGISLALFCKGKMCSISINSISTKEWFFTDVGGYFSRQRAALMCILI